MTRTPLTLTGSSLAVLRALVERGPSTRPQLGQDLGLSRPTMSAAIVELIQAGLVEPIGAVQGGMGRRAVEYRVATHAGHVIAVDAGSTHIRLRLSTLDRRLLHSSLHPLPQSQYALTPQISAVVAAAVAEALARTEADWGPLQAMVIAVPTRVVGPEGDTAATDQEVIYSNFTPPPQVDCTLANNVNCAAVAEYHYGAAQGRQTFAFLQVGVKIGLPTRDSFLPIIATLMASSDVPVSVRVGREPSRFTASDRLQDVPLAAMQALVSILAESSNARAIFLAGFGLHETGLDLTDGVRMSTSTGRILHVRPSGNAPELRLYVEASDPSEAEETLVTGLALLRKQLFHQSFDHQEFHS